MSRRRKPDAVDAMLAEMAELPDLAWIAPHEVGPDEVPQVARNLRAKSDAELVDMWKRAERGGIAPFYLEAMRYIVTIAQRHDFDALGTVAFACVVEPLDLSDAEERAIFERHAAGAVGEIWRTRYLSGQVDLFDDATMSRCSMSAAERGPARFATRTP